MLIVIPEKDKTRQRTRVQTYPSLLKMASMLDSRLVVIGTEVVGVFGEYFCPDLLHGAAEGNVLSWENLACPGDSADYVESV